MNRRFIFIGDMPHSATNLLSRIVDFRNGFNKRHPSNWYARSCRTATGTLRNLVTRGWTKAGTRYIEESYECGTNAFGYSFREFHA